MASWEAIKVVAIGRPGWRWGRRRGGDEASWAPLTDAMTRTYQSVAAYTRGLLAPERCPSLRALPL
eukprot:874216-Prorocentrum_minimum.AAC.1